MLGRIVLLLLTLGSALSCHAVNKAVVAKPASSGTAHLMIATLAQLMGETPQGFPVETIAPDAGAGLEATTRQTAMAARLFQLPSGMRIAAINGRVPDFKAIKLIDDDDDDAKHGASAERLRLIGRGECVAFSLPD